MKLKFQKIFSTTIICLSSLLCFSQPFSISLTIKNQPERKISLGLIKGDNIIPIDSSLAENGSVSFVFPEQSVSGMYRLNFGQTKYAQIMNEDPQTLDFVYNKENIVLECDFETPSKSTRIIESKENKVWFRFLKQMGFINTDINLLEKEVNLYWKKEENDKAIKAANQYNQLQIERDLLITTLAKENSDLFVSQLLEASKSPILDGYLTEEERKKEFQNKLFKTLSFNNEALIYSQIYSDKIFEYLISYNDKSYSTQQREAAYIIAIDIILENTSQNKVVNSFISEYLIDGFKLLNMNNLIAYIKEHN
jgi:hypothetical protein